MPTEISNPLPTGAEVRQDLQAIDTQPIATLDAGRLVGVPYLQNWFGLWAIHEPAAQELLFAVQQLDIPTHLASRLNLESHLPDPMAAANPTKPYQVDASNIATLRIDGTMLKHQSSFSGGTSTVQLRRSLRQALADPAVKGIMLILDTPGGTVAGSYDLADEVAASTKPIHAYSEDMTASAGYLVASQTTRFTANSNATVGSIGTFLQVADYSKLYADKGVKMHVIRSADLKGTGAPGAEITDAQLADLQRYVTEMNDLFLAAVQRGRKMTPEQVAKIADGRVHVGSKALEMGLIDAVETIDQAYQQLVSTVRGTSMSVQQNVETQAVAPASPPPVAPAAPAAASLQEIQAACPGASADFIVEQCTAGATVAQATTAWMTAQAAENAKLKEQLAQQPAPKPKHGIDPIVPNGKQTQVDAFEDAKQEWDAAVTEQMKSGKSKHDAVLAVAAKQPDLRKALVEQANANRKPREE